MRIAILAGLGLLALAALGVDAQPAYKCFDAEGRLMLIQGDPPPGAKCSEEPTLRPSPRTQRPAGLDLPRPAVDWKWDRALRSCTEAAKRSDPRFDAYAPQPGEVRMLGTTETRHHFEKCMAEWGQPLGAR
jgi:hypothetical protein